MARVLSKFKNTSYKLYPEQLEQLEQDVTEGRFLSKSEALRFIVFSSVEFYHDKFQLFSFDVFDIKEWRVSEITTPVRMPVILYNKLRSLAEKLEMTIGKLVRSMISEYYKNRDQTIFQPQDTPAAITPCKEVSD